MWMFKPHSTVGMNPIANGLRRTVPWCTIGIVTLSCGVARAALDEEELKSAICQQVLNEYEQIETLQIRFSMKRTYLHKEAGLDPERFVNKELRDGFYAYDKAGRQYVEFVAVTHKGQVRQQIASKLGRAGPIRRLDWLGDDTTNGYIYKYTNLPFEPEGPQAFLNLLFIGKYRADLLDEKCEIQLQQKEDLGPTLVLGARTGRGFQFRLSLDERRGLTPHRYVNVFNGVYSQQTDVELFEAIPGVWLPETGVELTYAIPNNPKQVFLRQDFTLDRESIKINEKLDNSLFELPFPAGTRVEDSIHGTLYVEGLKSGQGQRRQVQTFAKHADIMAPKKLDKDSASSPAPGTVVAKYRAAWYQSAALWIVVGAVILAVVGFALIRRAG